MDVSRMLLKGLEDYLASGRRQGAHIDMGDYKAYIRNSQRMFGGEPEPTLDIAQLQRTQGPPMSPGDMQALLAQIETIARNNGMKNIFAENMLTPRHGAALKRLGFQDEPGDTLYPRLGIKSYYKKL